MDNFGRHRQSIADIEQQLSNIIDDHPECTYNDEGEPVIPAAFLLDIFAAFSERNNGFELATPQERIMTKQFIEEHPEIPITPQGCIQFFAQKTMHASPTSRPLSLAATTDRGRQDERTASGVDSRETSRQTSRDPQTPGNKAPSPFDASKRQRSTPLGAAPSSWASAKRPAPAHRRKSDAGSKSDSESSFSAPSPGSFARTPGRSRAPSNPTSPSSEYNALSPVNSPPLGNFASRPHSRAQSQPQSHFNTFHPPDDDDRRSDESDEDDNDTSVYNYRSGGGSATIRSRNNNHNNNSNQMEFANSVSSLPMPRSNSDEDDSDDSDSDSALGLVMDRSTASSTVSMEPLERLDALQRTNADLGRKLVEADRTLQNKLAQHESELEELQGRLEEMRSELSASKREEKELRSKERQNMSQMQALEGDVAKTAKALEHARATYTSLQRQYQEQCSASEKYRDDLRQREEVIRNLRDAAALHELETTKWQKEQQSYEDRIASLEKELIQAEQAHASLDEQKQENLLLKETIDRMRFDMDEMRVNAASGAMGSGASSKANTISKSLGAELMGQLSWGPEDEDTDTAVEEGGEDDNDTEGEDVIQTIITRKRRVGGGRTNNKLETTTFEETREYSTVGCQHDPTPFISAISIQTDPEPVVLKVAFSVQTDEEEVPLKEEFSIQTEPEEEPEVIPERVMVEMDVQTDEIEEVSSSSSSSSTAVPSTPQRHTKELPDQPPAYNQIIERSPEEQRRLIAEYHPTTADADDNSVIPAELAEDWEAIKKALGTGCVVIDKVVADKHIIPNGKDSKNGRGKYRGKFYNIYNTYVYGNGNKDRSSSASSSGGGSGSQIIPNAPQLAICIGVVVLSCVGQYILLPNNVPDAGGVGGANGFDRMAWYSYNSMGGPGGGEGFGMDGTSAAWDILGRVGIGAARIARGFT